MFEWDPRKAKANPDKHGVPFDEAVTIFLDADALDGPDLQHSTDEARFRRLGRSAEGRILNVEPAADDASRGARWLRRRNDPRILLG